MRNRKCDCLFNIIVSVLLGILIGYVYYIGLLTGIIIALWILLGAAGIGLVLLTILTILNTKETKLCICANSECLGLGTIGTLILATLLLSITLTIENVAIAIIIGLLGVFALLSVISVSKILCCLINKKCKCRESKTTFE